MNKILISGGYGLIGSNLAKSLLKDNNCEILIIDNCNDYYPRQVKTFNAKGIPHDNILYCDLTDYFGLMSIFEKFNPDIVVHLSAQAGIQYSELYPERIFEDNITAFDNIISLSRIYNVKRFIYASSSSVYGNKDDLIPSKETDKRNPKSLYAYSKCYNEDIAKIYSERFGLETVGLRFFTVYGKGGRPDMALYKFVDALTHDEEIHLYNNGENVRDFTWVDDIVNVIKLLIYTVKTPRLIYNIGENDPIMVKDVVKYISMSIHKEPKIVYEDKKEWDINYTSSDVSALYEDFEWKPQYNFAFGIGVFVDWYNQLQEYLRNLGIERIIQDKETLKWTIKYID